MIPSFFVGFFLCSFFIIVLVLLPVVRALAFRALSHGFDFVGSDFDSQVRRHMDRLWVQIG